MQAGIEEFVDKTAFDENGHDRRFVEQLFDGDAVTVNRAEQQVFVNGHVQVVLCMIKGFDQALDFRLLELVAKLLARLHDAIDEIEVVGLLHERKKPELVDFLIQFDHSQNPDDFRTQLLLAVHSKRLMITPVIIVAIG